MDRVCDWVDQTRVTDEVECELCAEAEWSGVECAGWSRGRQQDGEDEKFCTAFTQVSVLPASHTSDCTPLS